MPQWPSRDKFIDLVITDVEGRRLAIEADGEQHHEMNGGALIPEDIERQGLLEEAGWVFHRIRHSDFKANPDQEISRLLAHLREQPANADLAARIRGDELPASMPAPSSKPGGVSRGTQPLTGATAVLVERGSTGKVEPLAPAEEADLRALAAEAASPSPTGRSEERDADEDRAAARSSGNIASDGSASEHEEAADEPELARFDPAMSPRQMDSLIDEVFAELDAVKTVGRGSELRETGVEVPNARPSSAAGSATTAVLADVPLRIMALKVATAVAHHGAIDDGDLIDRFSTHHNVEVPRNLRSLLVKFAWSAKGHEFVTFDGTTWTPGDKEPHEIDNFGEWTFSAVVDRAKELLPAKPEKQVYEQLLHEIYPTPSGRVPRIVTTVAGKAIWQAQHS